MCDAKAPRASKIGKKALAMFLLSYDTHITPCEGIQKLEKKTLAMFLLSYDIHITPSEGIRAVFHGLNLLLAENEQKNHIPQGNVNFPYFL